MVAFREGTLWLAQGLEKDIGVQASSLADLMHRLALAVRLESAAGDLEALPAAPPYFHPLWEARCGMFTPSGAPFESLACAISVAIVA